MANNGNIYGVQKVPETSPIKGTDIALQTTESMAQGAMIGSKFGPIGAGIGAAGGAIMGFMGAEANQAQQELAQGREKSYNKFVDSLEGRDIRSSNLVRAQARYGMKTSKYKTAEIEGDGSNNYAEGIGEIHVDKNYNLKTVAKGAPTHEEGGVKIDVKKGDTIYPTQNNPEEYNKVMASIKRYKSNGDKRAKKYLDMKRDALPSDKDYGYAKHGKKYQNGLGSRHPADLTDLESKSTGGGVVTGDTSEQPSESGRVYTTSESDPFEYRKIDKRWETRLKGAKDWEDMDSNARYKDGIPILEDMFGREEPVEEIQRTKTSPGLIQEDPIPRPRIPEPKGDIDPLTSPGAIETKAEKIVEGEAQPLTKQEAEAAREMAVKRERREGYVDDFNNPLKYASAVNNLITGLSPADKVIRRFATPEPYEYQDRSYAQRRAVTEQRNAANQMLRGKGLSIGQQQSYMGQTGSRALGAQEAINEREAQRADRIDMANVGTMNQTQLRNLTLANQYDVMDAQNEAARKRYKDRAFADVSELAQLDEQRRYMKSRDERAFDIQEKAIPLVGTTDFAAPNKEEWWNIDIRPETREREVNLSKMRYGLKISRYK